MTHIELNRFCETKVQTRGHLVVYESKAKRKRVFSCFTLELPWRGNNRRVSCIPPGEYKARHREAHESGLFNYPHFIVKDVPNRDYILFHAGNTYRDTLGCILTGTDFKDINSDGEPDTINSRTALKGLREATDKWSSLEILSVRDYAMTKRPTIQPATIKVEARGLEGTRLLTLV